MSLDRSIFKLNNYDKKEKEIIITRKNWRLLIATKDTRNGFRL